MIYTDSINWTGPSLAVDGLFHCLIWHAFLFIQNISPFLIGLNFIIFITCWFWPNLENVLGYTIIAIGHSDIKEWCTVWHEIFAGVYFCVLGTIGFSCWELIISIFRKYSVPNIDGIFVFIKYVQLKFLFFKQDNRMRTLCKTSNSLYTILFLNEKGKL